MKYLVSIAVTLVFGATLLGCSEKKTSGKTTVTIKTTPEGETKTTIEEKLEVTPHSATKTTTEKIEIKP